MNIIQQIFRPQVEVIYKMEKTWRENLKMVGIGVTDDDDYLNEKGKTMTALDPIRI